jgi:predicted MPP superfamily phosphohydrolase
MKDEIRDDEVHLIPDEISTTLFHKVLVRLDRVANWSSWLMFIIVFGLSVTVGLTWLLVTGQPQTAVFAGALFLVFVLLDALLLVALPLLSISFGSWKSQLIVLMMPRGIVAISAGMLTSIIEPFWGLLAMVLVELLGSLLIFWGSLFEVRQLKLTRLRVTSESMEPESQPLRILHISDLHIEKLTHREEKLIDLMKQVKPDLIVLTGDYLNLSYVHDKDAQMAVKKLLRQLTAPSGVFAVLGGPTVDDRSVVPGLFEDLPIRLLVNDWFDVKMQGDQQIVLLGVDCSQHMPTDTANLVELVDASPNGVPRILLYHTPDLMPLASKQGVDLYLCGHTHGGQIRVPIYGAILTSSKHGKRYEMGRYIEGNTNLYVSRGVGLEGLGAPRIRLFAPPEITLITIEGNREAKQEHNTATI